MNPSGDSRQQREKTGSGDASQGEDAAKRSGGAFVSFSRMYRDAAPYLALGIQLAATVIILFYVGYWADDYFGTQPWLMIAGLAAGVAAGFYNFFRTVVDLGKKADDSSSSLSTRRVVNQRDRGSTRREEKQ